MTGIKDTICQYAWDYPVLSFARNELRFCCRTKTSNLNQIPDKEFAKGKDIFTGYIPIIELRKSLLKGERHESCGSCWQMEDSSGFSQRAGFKRFVSFVKKNRAWPELSKIQIEERLLNITDDYIEDLIKIDDTRMVEIMLGNTCDLKCMYCNHHYSSQWASEKLKYKEIEIANIETELPKIKNTVYEDIWWDWFEYDAGYKTCCINFIGGEPLIMDKFYSYVKRVINFYETHDTPQRKIDLSIVSNFNTPKKYYEKFLDVVINIASSEKIQLDFNVSCESIGDRAEFIRTGTDWPLMKSNIENFLKNMSQIIDPNEPYNKSKIIFNFQIALNALCISDLPNFFNYIIELQRSTNMKIHLRQNQVVYPRWLNAAILPCEYSKYIDDSIDILKSEIKNIDVDNYAEFGRWNSYIRFLETIKRSILDTDKNTNDRKEFAFQINQLSERRNLNFYDTFPEMIDFYEECKKL
jgi:organic radical activating enzyme